MINIKRFRKKYTQEEAKNQIQLDQMMIETCSECINTFIVKWDPLIQVLVWKTKGDIIKENQEKINFLTQRILYCKQFL